MQQQQKFRCGCYGSADTCIAVISGEGNELDSLRRLEKSHGHLMFTADAFRNLRRARQGDQC